MLQSLMMAKRLLLRSYAPSLLLPFSYAPSLLFRHQFQFQKQQNSRSISSDAIGNVFITSGVFVSLYYYINVNVVPYLKCRRFISIPTCLERFIADREYKKIPINNVLPHNDPQSVRVRWLLNDIVDGLRREILLNQDRSCVSLTLSRHLGKLNWEILLVEDGELPAMYGVAGSGKIIMNLKWLQYYGKDDDIASAIAHEIGHNVARHMVEQYLEGELLSVVVIPSLFNRWVNVRLRQEKEADRIGLMLFASAGYDPQLALKLYEKMEQLQQNGTFDSVYEKMGVTVDSTHDVIHMHPHTKERAQLLASYMEEALAIYSNVQASHLIQVRKEGGLELIPRKIRSEED